jgi:hypothetical protein
VTLDELKTLFDFTDDDLVANQHGRISARQMARMQADVEQMCRESAAAVLLIPVQMAVVVGFFLVVVPAADQLGPLVLALIFGWITASFLLIRGLWRVLIALFRRFGHNPLVQKWLCWRRGMAGIAGESLRRGIVTRIAGIYQLISDGEHDQILLDDQELINSVMAEDSDERLWTLTPGQRYAIYRVPDVLWVVAVVVRLSERLRTTNAERQSKADRAQALALTAPNSITARWRRR